jgi:hypothetical protein
MNVQRYALIAVLALALPASLAAAQGPAIVKDPALATVLSVILPGGGQFYSERSGKGVVILGTSLLGGAAALSYQSSQCVRNGGTSCTAKELLNAGVAAAAVGWLFGVVTAGDDARRFNAASALAQGSNRPCMSRDVAEVDGENMAVRVYATEADGTCAEHRCNLMGAGVSMTRANAIRACHEQVGPPKR